MDENLKEKYEKLANLIFPDVTETVEDLEKRYPERNLKEETMQFVNLECENYEVNNEEIRNKYILLLEELEKKYN